MLLIEIQDDMIKVNEKANYFKHIIYSRLFSHTNSIVSIKIDFWLCIKVIMTRFKLIPY